MTTLDEITKEIVERFLARDGLDLANASLAQRTVAYNHAQGLVKYLSRAGLGFLKPLVEDNPT